MGCETVEREKAAWLVRERWEWKKGTSWTWLLWDGLSVLIVVFDCRLVVFFPPPSCFQKLHGKGKGC